MHKLCMDKLPLDNFGKISHLWRTDFDDKRLFRGLVLANFFVKIGPSSQFWYDSPLMI